MSDQQDKGAIANDGWPVLAAAGLTTILLSFMSPVLGAFGLGLLLWLAHLLRNPDRAIIVAQDCVIAPIDGVVMAVTADVFPGQELDAEPDDAMRITIRNRLTDVQIALSPVTGHIVENALYPGLFNSWGDSDDSWRQARDINERREICFRDERGRIVTLVQLATRTARQLVCRHNEGKFLRAGDPVGMARMGGVYDLYVPQASRCDLRAGQNVIAGETVIARLAARKGKGSA